MTLEEENAYLRSIIERYEKEDPERFLDSIAQEISVEQLKGFINILKEKYEKPRMDI